MIGWLSSFYILLASAAVPVETQFVQVAPAPRASAVPVRSTQQVRAVVLIHGLRIHPPGSKDIARPRLAPWQEPDSPLVRALAREADVFAFSYGQTIPVGEVAALPGLTAGIRRLRELGYQQVVLVGFSAGGLVARQFVEDGSDAGVTKVIQVCAPNGGSGWARLQAAAPGEQLPFIRSLSKEARTLSLRDREGKAIPEMVQFVCVVGTGLGYGDGIVTLRSQWPEDLQRQGIPAVLLRTPHLKAVRKEDGARLIAELVCADQPRWNADQVQRMRERVGDKSLLDR